MAAAAPDACRNKTGNSSIALQSQGGGSKATVVYNQIYTKIILSFSSLYMSTWILACVLLLQFVCAELRLKICR